MHSRKGIPPSVSLAGTALLGLIYLSPILKAQSPPAFEVASVKPHPAGQRVFNFPQFMQGGRFTTTGQRWANCALN